MAARLQPDTWAAVMSQVANKNEAALAQLYDGTSKIVYGMALRVVRDPWAAEDITIEVFTCRFGETRPVTIPRAAKWCLGW
jgi:DNA-directed RNA polymerase specialized sigma24 family protein